MITRAAILGTGSWGTSLACLLANKLDEVCLIGRNQKTADEINDQHSNHHYIPNLSLAPNIVATTDMKRASDYPLILFVVPTSATESTSQQLASIGIPKQVILVSCAKGISSDGERMSQIIHRHLPDNPLAVLSGPNHAEEVSRNLATRAVIGAEDRQLREQLQDVFNCNFFRCYTSDDIAGIELGGAIKNVFSIAAGIADGIGLGDNAIAALVTRGLAEMTRLGIKLGANPQTLGGLAGLGDLILTCTSTNSRNYSLGIALGEGGQDANAADIMASRRSVSEGALSAPALIELATKHQVEMPICKAIADIVAGHVSVDMAISQLLARPFTSEI